MPTNESLNHHYTKRPEIGCFKDPYHPSSPPRENTSTSSISQAEMRELHTTVLGEIDCSWQRQKGIMRPVLSLICTNIILKLREPILSEHGPNFGGRGGTLGSFGVVVEWWNSTWLLQGLGLVFWNISSHNGMITWGSVFKDLMSSVIPCNSTVFNFNQLS